MNNQQNEEVPSVPSTKTKQTYRNTNASEFITNGEPYQLFPDGILVSKTKLVRNIKKDNVPKVLYASGLNTLALNPHLSEDEIFNCLCSINNNKKQVNIPLKYSELIKITANIFKKRNEEGELQPNENHIRKIILDDVNFPMTTKEKRKIINKGTGILKSNKTKQTIYNAIEAWDKPEKITINKIMLEVGMCERTVKKYYSECKDSITSINAGIKANKVAVVSVNEPAAETILIEETIQPEASNEVCDTLEDFKNIARFYAPNISNETLKRYYGDMGEIGMERSRNNIKSILTIG